MKRLVAAACVLFAWVACDPQKADWGFEAIDGMKTPPDDPSLGCGVTIPPDPSAAKRAQCAFTAGAHAADTLGIDEATRAKIPIRHVIVMMKENRSFDHLLGKIHDLQPDAEAVPATFTNPDANGNPVAPFHASTTCIADDPNHQSKSIVACIDGGKMDGFVKNAAATTDSDGSFVMSFYDASDLPYDYWLASTFALADRHFASMASGTFANRDFMMFGTNEGVVDTGILYPPPTTPSIFQELMNAGFTWGAYSDGGALSDTLAWTKDDPGVHPLGALLDALGAGTLPNVAFVDGIEDTEDDHPSDDGPPDDLQRGEAWTKKIIDAAIASPEWERLVVFWTYDECGAFADHVPPPSACAPAPSSSSATEMGPRVPFVAVSPWAKRHYVSHVVHGHTAITRFIETLFDLPALTARDANSDALFDLFDFSCPGDPSVAAAPDPGTGGCSN
jgi:phospholipase C